MRGGDHERFHRHRLHWLRLLRGRLPEAYPHSQMCIRDRGWRDRLYEAVTADFAVTDEQLRAYYDEACATAELTYTADPQSYETDRLNGETVFWNPEGYRLSLIHI